MNKNFKIIACFIAVGQVLLFNGCVSTKTNIKRELEAPFDEEEKKEQAIKHFQEGAKELFNNNEASAESFKKARDLDPGMSSAFYNEGLALEQLSLFDEAQKAYQSCLKLDEAKFECLDNWLLVKHKLGLNEEGQALVDDYSERFSQEPQNHAVLAKWYFLQGDLALAEKYARLALERQAENIEALYMMARIFYAQEKYAAVKWVAKNALENAPSHGNFHLLLGHAQAATGLMADALDSYRLAVKNLPSQEARESLGLLLLKRGLVKEALANFAILAEQFPKVFRNRLHLANAYFSDKQFENSLKEYLAAKELDSEDSVVNFNLGLLYLDLKPENVDELERLKTAQNYFSQYLSSKSPEPAKIEEVKKYLASLQQKIELEEYARSSQEEFEEGEPLENNDELELEPLDEIDSENGEI